MSHAIHQRRKISLSDGRWLLLGVIVHALILLIPLRELSPGSLTKSAELVVRLVAGEPKNIAQDVVLQEPTAEEVVREVLAPRPGIADILEVGKSRKNARQEGPETRKDVSTARIMGMRESLTRRVPVDPEPAGPLQLGQPRAYSPPANWQPHAGAEALAPFDNLLNGMTVAEKVEVVDRWTGSDGSRNVVVETPAGLRLCGRASAPDPMRPHIETVMHFHVCGGDGAMPFRFRPRERLNRDFIDPVAKDANQP